MRWMRGMDRIWGLQFYTDGQDGEDLGILPPLEIGGLASGWGYDVGRSGSLVRVRWIGLGFELVCQGLRSLSALRPEVLRVAFLPFWSSVRTRGAGPGALAFGPRLPRFQLR